MKKALIFAAVAAITTLHANHQEKQSECCPCFEPGLILDPCHAHEAYSKSARFDVKGDWDFFGSVAFDYWYVSQDGMDIAIPYLTVLNGPIAEQSFKYSPGFQVGVGLNTPFDGWVWNANYTWVRNHTTSSAAAPSGKEIAGTTWLYTNDGFFHGSLITSSWHMNMDILDVTAGRPFYSGQRLTVHPFGGLRALWIRQAMSVAGTSDAINESSTHSHSWALGARGGTGANWLLGRGFRTTGDVAGSVLYTQYTTLSTRQIHETITTPSGSFSPYGTVRFDLESSLGLGWSSYAYNQKFFFDFEADYTFKVFFHQNMIRYVADIVSNLTGGTPGSLFMQGLTLKGSFMF